MVVSYYRLLPSSFYSRNAAAFEKDSSEDESLGELSEDSSYEPSSVSSDSSFESSDTDNEVEDTATATNTSASTPTSSNSTMDAASADQSIWTSVSAGQRMFGFSGQERLCNQAVASHMGKVWQVVVFTLLLSSDIIGLLVTGTNCYFSQLISAQSVTCQSRLNAWKPTTFSEMRIFIGILFSWDSINCLK